MNEAAKAGSGLGSSLGGLVAAGGGAIGIVAALAAGAVKLASGWAEGGAQLGRLSTSLGVSTDDLQKFQAVGEQFGMSKEEATSAVGGIGGTLHEAKAGRNNDALAAMNYLKIAPKYGANGQPDIMDFTKQLSDAIARQTDPYTQARIANLFGAGSALTMLRAGSGEVSRRMTDAGKYAAVMDSQSVTDASRIWGKGVLGKQLAGRGGMLLDAGAARKSEGLIDSGLSLGRNAADHGGDIAKAMASATANGVAGAASAGVAALGGAAKWAAGEVAGMGGIIKAAMEGERKTGVPALLTVAQADLESGHLKHMPVGSNNPFGIKARPGEPYVEAMTTEHLHGQDVRVAARFRKFDSLEEAVQAHDELLAHGRPYAAARGKMSDPYAYAAAISPHYATDQKYDSKLEHEMHTVEVRVYDHRTTAKVKRPDGSERAVAIGHAMQGSGP